MGILRLIFALAFLAAFSFTDAAVAKMYKWTDENGAVHFSDTPPPNMNQPHETYATETPNAASGQAQPSILDGNPDRVIEFTDDFEYTDSPANHGWRFRFGGSQRELSTTTEIAHSGSRSLKGFFENTTGKHDRFGISYDLSQDGIGKSIGPRDAAEVVVYWYDDGVTDSGYNFHPELNYKEPGGMTASLSIHDTGRGKYSFQKPDGYGWNYFGQRTAGWHEIKFLIQNNTLDLYFDGTLVSRGHGEVGELLRLSWSSNIIAPGQFAMSWIDSVRVTRTVNR